MTYTYNGPDVLSTQLLEAFQGKVDEFVAVTTRLQAADGDRDKALALWVETSDDPKAVQCRDAIQRAESMLREMAEAAVVSETLSDTDKAKLEEEQKELRQAVRHSKDAILSVAESFGTDLEGVKAALEEIGDPTKGSRGRAKGTTGSSLPRVSVDIVVTGGEDAFGTQKYDAFSKMANTINAGSDTAVKDLQEAFANAAGVEHADISSVKTPVEFDFTPEGSKVTYHVATTPKARKAPAKPAEETAPETPLEQIQAGTGETVHADQDDSLDDAQLV